MSQDVLITGASTGIGRAAVKALTGRGRRMFAGVRKPADADSLRKEFGDKVLPLHIDVTGAATVRAAAADIRAKHGGRTPKGLVNNAGMAIGGLLALQPLDEIRRVF
jgi:NAD(P)-dependent dehydrogenase (short-subunit alcohol dehydrogenase family)